jgi:hypothetical protein
MKSSWRPLLIGAAFLLVAGVKTAPAQTIVVRKAPVAAPVEVLFEGAVVGTAIVDALGDGTVLTKTMPGEEELAVSLHVDTCGTTIRVHLVPRGVDPPVAADCTRRSIPGFFVVRQETTLVMDLEPGTPTVLIRQGRVPADWLLHGPIPTGRRAPVGLLAYGGAGIINFAGTIEQACGQGGPCTREDTKLAYTFGANYWLTRYLGGEASLLRPAALSVEGSGTSYSFATTFKPNVWTVGVLGGLPVGPARFYGRAGANYHGATLRTVQVTAGRTLTVDGVTQSFPALTQTFVLKTAGWAPAYGFGVEGWVGDKAALYAEYVYTKLEGVNIEENSEGEIDDVGKALMAGVKIHFGYRR